jgi:excisionase family DNA binding protein
MQSTSTRQPANDEAMAISYRDAARRLSVCERTVWGLVRDGHLQAVRIGRSVRIPVAELERFVAGRQD